MWSLETDAELEVGEPANHFEPALGAQQSLPVAGGIGTTPLIGMAQLLQARGAGVRPLYTARSPPELAFHDLPHATLGERLQVFATAAGQRVAFADEIAALHPDALPMVCGPLTMLDAARAAWAHKRPTWPRFHTFGNSGAAANEAFWPRHATPRHRIALHCRCRPTEPCSTC
jgi:vanillate O-demethylase ferredoxin subunit